MKHTLLPVISILFILAILSLVSCLSFGTPGGTQVSLLAGSTGGSGYTDATGDAARFSNPSGIACDGANLYVTDSRNSTIRMIVTATEEVTTLAGTGGGFWGWNDGTGDEVLFWYPSGIACDGKNLYMADSYNHTIRKIDISTGMVTTLAGKATSPGREGGEALNAGRFNRPSGIVYFNSALYVTDTENHAIRKISGLY